jgi:hypothetical protein
MKEIRVEGVTTHGERGARRHSPGLRATNLFSSDVFLRTLGEVYFAGRRSEPGLFAVDGRVYRLLVVDGAPITSWPFVDFFEPLLAVEGPARALGYLPGVALEICSAEHWQSRPPTAGLSPSPFVEWARFERWDDFAAHVSARAGNRFGDFRRPREKLVKALGDVELRLDDRRPETLELGMKWKSAQFLAAGHRDPFADAENRRLFTLLQARDLVHVSSLSAGGRVVAVHLGASHEGCLYYWLPSYDPEVGKLSPGRVMMESLLRASFERGDQEFDFLIGDEAYKWRYATHARVIGDAGVPPLRLRLERELKRRVKQALRGMPWLLERWPRLKERASR